MIYSRSSTRSASGRHNRDDRRNANTICVVPVVSVVVSRDMAIVYRSRVFSVEETRRRFPNGQEHDIVVVRHSPSVVLIPIETDGRLILIRQYRASVDRELWEFPAGRVDEGESPEAAARRECEEEIGRVPADVERVGAFYPATATSC